MDSDISAAVTTICLALLLSTYILVRLLVKSNKKIEAMQSSLDSLKEESERKNNLVYEEVKEVRRIGTDLAIKVSVMQIRNEDRNQRALPVIQHEILPKRRPGRPPKIRQ